MIPADPDGAEHHDTEAAASRGRALRPMTRPSIPLRRRAGRFVRKHALALVGLAAFHLLFFFPTLFMGRVLSPADIYYNYDPWRTLRSVEAQNPLLNDPATAYATLMSLLRDDPDAFHWNRFVGSGIPGTGSAAAAVLSPFIAVPALLLPWVAMFSGVVLLKLNVAFLFTYLWLRVERVGRRGAAVGAMAFAASGVFAVWWLWQGTNATALYPAVLYVLARITRGERVAFATTAVVSAALLLSGFPATMVYIAWLALAYAIVALAARRVIVWREAAKAIAAVVAAIVATMPFLAPFVQLLRRSGYLEARTDVAAALTFPLRHLRAFFDPYIYGDPAVHLWIGDPALRGFGNFVESTVYVGISVIVVASLALLRARNAFRWFWFAMAAILVMAIFGVNPVDAAVAKLPGVGYSPLTRLRVLLPIPLAYLAASGAAWLDARLRRTRARDWFSRAVVVVVAAELALFAANFYPYLKPSVARLPESPTIAWLHRQPGPFRVAPMFDFLWPNTAELAAVEDVRSHFGSEKRYRDLLQRIDPGAWGGSGTVLQFNSLRMELSDPLLSMLNARYLIEQPSIDIIRWKVYEKTEATGGNEREFVLTPGSILRRTITLDARRMWAIDFSVALRGRAKPDGTLTARLIRPETGKTVWNRSWTPAELAKFDKIYVPVTRDFGDGHAVVVELEPRGLAVALPRDAVSGDVTLGLVRGPLVHAATLPDGRVFENLAANPRFTPVWDVRSMAFGAMLAARDIDYGTTAIVENPDARLDGISSVSRAARRAHIRIEEYGGTRSRIVTRSGSPFLLVSSEKLTPELRVDVDGRRVPPLRVNGLFAAVPVAAGEHQVVFERRVGRGWWPAACAAWVVIALSLLRPRQWRVSGAVAPRG